MDAAPWQCPAAIARVLRPAGRGRLPATPSPHPKKHRRPPPTCLPAQIEGEDRIPLITAPEAGTSGKGRLLVITAAGKAGGPPRAAVDDMSWPLLPGAVTTLSASTDGDPSFIFSSVEEGNPELFLCVVIPKGWSFRAISPIATVQLQRPTFDRSQKRR
jgi:hypothetical protein